MNANSGNHIERRKKDSARLVWDTKPKRAANPKDIEFQTAEIVIPNPHRDQERLPSFMENLSKTTIDRTKMNRLIWGDNLLAMQALLASGYEGKINTIYIDPPFWTGENYYTNVTIGHETVEQSPPVAQRLAFKDIWSGGIDSYFDMLYPRMTLMKRLLSEKGSIFIHVDWHVGHYVKVLADEVFGISNFRNEIVRTKSNPKNYTSKTFGNIHDTIFFYSKTDDYIWNRVYEIRDDRQIAKDFPQVESGTGRRFKTAPLHASGLRHGSTGQRWKELMPPPDHHWRYTPDTLDKLEAQGRIIWSSTGNPRERIYADESQGYAFQDIWTGFKDVSQTIYPKQKNEGILDAIIRASSNPGDLVADFFCGSGTTLLVAERHNRRWIGCDFSKTAIQVARNRLVDADSRPFMLENIGNYQRHLIYLSGVRIYEMQKIVLKLYGATPREDLPDLGTRKSSDGPVELIYVSYPDRPVTAKKVEELAHLADKLDGTGYKRLIILGWDYEYTYEESLKERKRATQENWKTEVFNKTIPPEVYEYLKTAKTEEEIEPLRGKIHFHEKPYLKLAPPKIEKTDGDKAKVTIGIERYVIFDYPIEDEKNRQEIMEIAQKNHFALVDYWAIDWDHDNITFKSVWQAFRGFGRDLKEIPKTATKEMETGKLVTVAVRLVDVFGNDASASQIIDLRRI